MEAGFQAAHAVRHLLRGHTHTHWASEHCHHAHYSRWDVPLGIPAATNGYRRHGLKPVAPHNTATSRRVTPKPQPHGCTHTTQRNAPRPQNQNSGHGCLRRRHCYAYHAHGCQRSSCRGCGTRGSCLMVRHLSCGFVVWRWILVPGHINTNRANEGHEACDNTRNTAPAVVAPCEQPYLCVGLALHSGVRPSSSGYCTSRPGAWTGPSMTCQLEHPRPSHSHRARRW